ncbi:leucine-rich repeat protein [Ruminococcus albus]|uniref:Leucine rich repeat-containing protein n=1 Tax=Ruminococcus albus TaxID=1264 RepID=A0A1I1DAC5_RUMAL|nr:leucine-rich repeat protein [Ruminococcus albus]SFB71895.1 Leucine rich repeat-containing protein [Ruminococcus albus]
MKRIAAFAIALTVVFGGTAYLPCTVSDSTIIASADTSQGGFVVSKKGDGTCTVTGFVGKSENVEIPAQIFGLTVTEIGENAFLFNENMKTLVIPDTVKVIRKGAFSNCYELTTVKVGKGVEIMEDKAFFDCTKLASINIPENTMYLGRLCFAESSLKSVTMPRNDCVLGDQLFSGCTKLETLILPSKLFTIPQLMCYNCSSLKNVTIPESVCSIADGAFRGCSSLKTLNIPAAVQVVGDYAIGFDLNSNKVSGFTAKVIAGTAGETYVKKYGLNYTYGSGGSLKGDVNGDGLVNITDVSKCAAHIKGKKLLDSAAQARADVNGDGKINITDVTKIAAQVKGKKKL